MVEYIKRSSVHSIIEQTSTFAFTRGGMHERVDSLPSADVVEVRHGRWIDSNKKPVPWDEQNPTSPSGSAYCSECGEWLTGSDEYPAIGLYCPNCGSRMDKEDEYEAG